MEYGEKIRLLRIDMDLTQKDFCERLSIPLSTLNKIEGGFSNAGLSVIEKILSNDEYNYLSPWFFKKEANIEKLPVKNNVITNNFIPWFGDANESEAPYNSALNIDLPFYQVSASAGFGELIPDTENKNVMSFNREFLEKNLGINVNNAFLMFATGDSMSPTIKDDEIIIVEKYTDVFTDGVYVFRYEDQLLVKRLQKLPGGILKVISDNNIYSPWQIEHKNTTDEQFKIIGRVHRIFKSV